MIFTEKTVPQVAQFFFADIKRFQAHYTEWFLGISGLTTVSFYPQEPVFINQASNPATTLKTITDFHQPWLQYKYVIPRFRILLLTKGVSGVPVGLIDKYI